MPRSRTTRHETLGNVALFSFSLAVPDEIYILVFQPPSTALALLCLWHGCVEKFGDHRGQPLGAVRERYMRRAGEYGKLGTR
jgi:hypothetical protein